MDVPTSIPRCVCRDIHVPCGIPRRARSRVTAPGIMPDMDIPYNVPCDVPCIPCDVPLCMSRRDAPMSTSRTASHVGDVPCDVPMRIYRCVGGEATVMEVCRCGGISVQGQGGRLAVQVVSLGLCVSLVWLVPQVSEEPWRAQAVSRHVGLVLDVWAAELGLCERELRHAWLELHRVWLELHRVWQGCVVWVCSRCGVWGACHLG